MGRRLPTGPHVGLAGGVPGPLFPSHWCHSKADSDHQALCQACPMCLPTPSIVNRFYLLTLRFPKGFSCRLQVAISIAQIEIQKVGIPGEKGPGLR